MSAYELLMTTYNYPLSENEEQVDDEVKITFKRNWTNPEFEEAYEDVSDNLISIDEYIEKYGVIRNIIKDDFKKFFFENIIIIVDDLRLGIISY